MKIEDFGFIRGFRGLYEPFSNFCYAPIIRWGITFPTVEHAYQAGKNKNREYRLKVARVSTPGKAKAIGQRVVLREDWEEYKLYFMYALVKQKFTKYKDLAELLHSTGNKIIIETNTWHDCYWGECICDRCKDKTSKNALGILLMKVRQEL